MAQFLIMHPCNKGRSQKQNSEALRQSQFMGWNGYSSARCCVPYGYITTELDANGIFCSSLRWDACQGDYGSIKNQKGG